MIICGFPGIGKSFCAKIKTPRFNKEDFDSSSYNKTHDWAKNYVNGMRELKSIWADIIFCSSHEDVRKEVSKLGLFTCVYPSKDQKQDYLERYRQRGSSEEFIKLLDEKWDEWLTSMEEQKGCLHIVLKPGQFLSDVLR